MKAIQAPPGLSGFDANSVIDATMARLFYLAKYRFAVRYVRRVKSAAHDLTAREVDTLQRAGLGLMAVQHVESETSWIPTSAKGFAYGVQAAEAAVECGLPVGTNVWLDLEGVNPNILPNQILGYCREWYHRVASIGYTPGLYVGWHCGLSPAQLYSLPFEHYWAAYNLNADQRPAKRGVQMLQAVARAPLGCCEIQADVITPDRLGGLPIIAVPNDWQA